MGEKEKPVVIEFRRKNGSRALKPVGLETFNDQRITKLITTGGLESHCYQLCTGENEAVWKQVAIPEKGQQGILVIPVRRRSEKVHRPPGWMSSAWSPA